MGKTALMFPFVKLACKLSTMEKGSVSGFERGHIKGRNLGPDTKNEKNFWKLKQK